ncbi:MAG TPA: sulfotransferase domain-containing protein [Ornithinibacter sp.]|nr:sulfotransferase domain-containing protein [Ornithinibacter sp.]
MRRYRSIVYDSDRWHGVRLRPGDIVISTPPKCGTTWTQMICALLVFQTPALPAGISELSPWVDQEVRSRTALRSMLDAMDHRRFLKTHTPLDGLPRVDGVTYVCVGRDPRDVALSMDHHMANLNLETFRLAREAAAAEDGIDLPPLITPPPRLDDPVERFWAWVDNETPVTESGSSLRRTLEHLATFSGAGDVDVVLVHYDELQRDLEGEMRRLAAHLGIEVPEDRWPSLVEAATFASMKARASTTAPNAGKGFWRSDGAFFNRGTSGQWRAVMTTDADLVRYRSRVESIAGPDLASWAHRGWPPAL